MTGGMFDRLSEQVDNPEESGEKFSIADTLELPDDERALVGVVIRAGSLTIAELAEQVGSGEDEVAKMVGSLSMRGMLMLTEGVVSPSPMKKTARIKPGGLFDTLGDF
jgi:predicted transcriptional regulator